MIEHIIKKHSNRFVSSYVILCIDIFLAITSFSAACLLRFNFEIEKLAELPIGFYLFTILSLRIATFLFLKSYQGVIRHTGLEDVWLLSYTVGLGTIGSVALSLVMVTLTGNPVFYIPISVLIIDFFCCLFILVAARFMVKSLYWGILSQKANAIRHVLIYGTGPTALMTRDTLAHDVSQPCQLLGFIDENPHKAQKFIHGLRVMTRQEAFERFVHAETTPPEVIIALDSPGVQHLNEITDYFLERKVPVKRVPSLKEWINGRISANEIREIRIEDLLERDPIQLNNNQVSQQLAGKTILITGAAGSIGSELVRQVLRYKPRTLVLLDQAESALYELLLRLKAQFPHQDEHTQLVALIADVADETRMEHIFQQHIPDYIFHAAAYKHVPLMEDHPYEAIRVNVMGTRVMANLALAHGVSKFIMISTDKAVNPTNVMGATKRLAEMYVQSLNTGKNRTRFISTRFGNVLGSNGSVVKVFQEQIRLGGPLTVTHPDVIRYFMTIPEACQLVLEAGAMGNGGEVFVFDMGKPVRIVDLAVRMIRLSGLSAGRDIAIEFTGLRPGEKLYEELLNDNELTLPTHHPKIMIARVVSPKASEIKHALAHLELLLKDSDPLPIVNWLKQLIPEYISQNSVFESLDSSLPQNNQAVSF